MNTLLVAQQATLPTTNSFTIFSGLATNIEKSAMDFTITFCRRIASCNPAPPIDMRAYEYAQVTYTHGRQKDWQHFDVRAYVREADGTLTIPAGCAPRLIADLRKAGHRVTVDDHRGLHQLAEEHDFEFYGLASDEQRRRCDRIISNRQFVLRTSPATAYETMGLVTRLYPKARILIPLPKTTKDIVNRVTMHMADYVGGNIGRGIGIGCDCNQRVATCSYFQFSLTNPAEWQVVLLPDADHAVKKHIADGIEPYDCQRVYGFYTPDAALTQRDRLRLEMLAGPIIDDDRRDAAGGRTVSVVFSTSGTGSVTLGQDPLDRKRHGIWQNPVRNQHIAEIARALAGGDVAALSLHFRVDRNPELFSGNSRSIVILVESPEHGRELAQLLPDWELVTATDVDTDLQNGSVGNRRIVTQLAANKLRDLAADVLIRVDGGDGGTQACVPSYQIGSIASQGHIVDFVDDFDPSFLAATRSRISEYERRGYQVSFPTWLQQSDSNNETRRRRPSNRRRQSTRK